MRLLSLDIPWSSASGNVGAAFAENDAEQIGQGAVVDSVSMNAPVAAAFPVAEPEIVGFINDGVGPGRARAQDLNGITFDYFPGNAADRAAYLQRLWNSFILLRQRLELEHIPIDLVTVDVPLVTGTLALEPIPANRRSRRRPVERAFEKKVWIPGNNPNRGDRRINLAVCQSGNINRYRPGYAVCRLAELCFKAATVVESFPQLTIGALAERASQNPGADLVTSVSEHKRNVVGQALLSEQLALVLPNPLAWVNPDLPVDVKADGYDAVLGLLPGLVYAGFDAPNADNVFQDAVLLRNLSHTLPPLPNRAAGHWGAEGTEPWKQVVAAHDDAQHLMPGIDDRGILAIDLNLWQ